MLHTDSISYYLYYQALDRFKPIDLRAAGTVLLISAGAKEMRLGLVH
jgi:hypothetical protein